MQELDKILEEIKRIKDGNRKEKLYTKYPPNSKDQEVLNAYSQGYEDGTDNFYNAVEEIIRKHMNDGWIPVEERLPEEAGTYIINALTGERNIVTFAKWQNRYKRFDMTGARTYWKIIAWRPLPEPYRPERRIKNA